MIKNLLITILVTCLLGGIFADVVEIQPDGDESIDTYIWEAYIYSNHGNSSVLHLGYFEGKTDILIKFNELDDYIGYDVNSATLELYGYYSVEYDTDENYIYRIDGDWSEIYVTWNLNPGYNDDIQVSFQNPSIPGWISVDVTEIVNSWMNEDFPHYGFYITNTLSSNGLIYSRSGESDISSERPKFILDYDESSIYSSSLGNIKSLFK